MVMDSAPILEDTGWQRFLKHELYFHMRFPHTMGKREGSREGGGGDGHVQTFKPDMDIRRHGVMTLPDAENGGFLHGGDTPRVKKCVGIDKETVFWGSGVDKGTETYRTKFGKKNVLERKNTLCQFYPRIRTQDITIKTKNLVHVNGERKVFVHRGPVLIK